MKLNIYVVLSLVFLASQYPLSTAAISGPNDLLSVQTSLQSEIQSLVKEFDPRAHVVIRAYPQKKKLKLPATPFSYQPAMFKDSSGKISLKRVEIVIMTSQEKLPDELKSLLNEMVSYYDVKPQLTIKNIPADKMADISGTGVGYAPTANVNNKLIENLIKTLDKRLAAAPMVATSAEATPQKAEPFKAIQTAVSAPSSLNLSKYAVYGVAGFAGFMLLAFLVGIRNRRAATNSLREMLDNGFNQLSEVIAGTTQYQDEDSSFDRATVRNQDRPHKHVPSFLSESKFIETMDDDGLGALLSDCYWGKSDEYAAFVWASTPLEKRRTVIEKNPHLARYASHICELNPINTGDHNDPYYMTPLPISHIDNEDLYKLTQSCTGLFQLLPRLRIRAMHLTPKERIELNKQSLENVNTDRLQEGLEKTNPSTHREFKHDLKNLIHSLEDEAEILSIRDLTIEDKAGLPSLGWLIELSGDKIEKILEPYSAEQLAGIWVGPKVALEYVAQFIPQDKFKEMQTYLEKVQPSRDSEIFHKIHMETLTAIQAQDSEESKDSSNTQNTA
jgi:hypothetical protein